jgi:hypothetical protein
MTHQIVAFFASPRQCPLCGAINVYRSHRRSLTDHLATLALLRPFRCGVCEFRHYALVFRKRTPRREKAKKQLLFDFPK